MASHPRPRSAARLAPAVRYPSELPITAAKDDIAAALRRSQVVVVAGETGSGKTTQLPKICLELGRGVDGMIGHTQPRRIAARAVAQRIAEELDVELGQEVGYQVRFTDRSSDNTLVKVMTDGVLLAEIQHDRLLRAYDTIIIDEAHERSLNIDFLLGYLHRLLPRRPDLKVIITSATIDPQRFARHFGDAPVIEVSGRTYPVEVRYRPLEDPHQPEVDRDQVQGVCDAVEELTGEGPGDVLVFLSGEREIRDTAEALRGMRLSDTEILPLYARLSAAEQHRVFEPHAGRRVVLSTNVAETSLTVPGIRYVVDAGTARISRYSNRTKVQRLPIEAVSQASANQRKGRCGRVADGICIRLYSEEDFSSRPEFTEPEILRTNLASVILQMAALNLGDVAAFPFLDPPDQRSVRDAVQLLRELGAISADDEDRRDPQLTPTGRMLARLPIDPRLGRMLVAAGKAGCVREMLVIVSGLSIQDPRERPAEQAESADALHGRFADERSDFLAWLNLWAYLRERRHALSSSQFRRLCRTEHLHYLRVREWEDLHSQLRRAVKQAGMHLNESDADHDAVHRALLAGLLSHVGLRHADTREYAGARGTRFMLWPGSALARRPPEWVMAAELVETSRLWGRTAARIDPQWAEDLAGHLVKRSYGEPRWSARRGVAVADERVTLYGLPIVAGRTVPYTRVDPIAARDIFIREALVAGRWRAHHDFLEQNRRLLDDLANVEERVRRRDIVVDDEVVHGFYDSRLPAHVVSARHFESWWRKTAKQQPGMLTMTAADVVESVTPEVEHEFPDQWHVDGVTLAVEYRFEPGAEDDGATVQVPLEVLPQLRPEPFTWHVPGLRTELVTTLIRSLPKAVRRELVPIPDVVREMLPRLEPGTGAVHDAVRVQLQALRGVVVPADALAQTGLPPHLRVTFRVVDGENTVASGKDLAELQHRLAPRVQAAVAEAVDDVERSGLTRWSLDELPQTVERRRDGHVVHGFPALVDEGDAVAVRVLLSREEQQHAMWGGTRRLLLLAAPVRAKSVHDQLDHATRLALTRSPHGSVGALLGDCRACAVDALMLRHGGTAWDAEGFHSLQARVLEGLEAATVDVLRRVARVLDAAHRAAALAEDLPPGATAADARRQLAGLVPPGFVTATGAQRLDDLVRYLEALAHRLAKARQDPSRDVVLLERILAVQEEFDALVRRVPAGAQDPRVRQIAWLIEELRVSVFAQHLGTRERVSEARLFRAIAAVA